MAQRVLVELLDDIDGSEAVGTFKFTDQGVEYEVDFNQEHMDEYEGVFSYLKSIARVVKGKKRAPYGSKKSSTPVVGKTQEMREWLRAAGHDVKDRGRVPANLVKIWEQRSQESVKVVEEVKEEKPEPVQEVPAKAPRKTAAARKTTTKVKTPATQEMATILAFKEPEDPAKVVKTTRTRKPAAPKV